MVLDVRQPHRSARPRRDNLGQAFGEDQTWTSRCRTAEPPYPDAQHNDAAVPRQIGQVTLIVAMHPRRCSLAAWTGRGRGGWSGEDNDAVSFGKALLDQQARRDQRQKTTEQLNTG